MLQIAISPCPNDVFTFGALILGKVKTPFELSFDFADIQKLNEKGSLGSTAPDVLKFSCALYPRLKINYDLCEAGAALGKGVGPLCVGQKGLFLKQREGVLLPGKDTTAARLFSLYAPKELQDKTAIMSYQHIMPELQKRPNWAGVIIHESRFCYEDSNLILLQDLGQAWEETTKLPLPLGAIGLHRRLSLETKSLFTKLLQNSLDWARKNPEDPELMALLKHHAQELNLLVINQHIELYVNDFSFELGKKGREAIEFLNAGI